MAVISMVKMKAWDGVREFPLEQAERLLTMDTRGSSGWTLADERYEFKEGVLTKKKKKED